MRIKKAKLEYWVFYISFQGNLEQFNILSGNFKDVLVKRIKQYKINDLKGLKEILRRDFIYRYWNKSECEYLICDCFGKELSKSDVWYQIKPNLDLIVKHINDEMKLGFE